MILVHSSEVKGFMAPAPHVRELKVLISPTIHTEAQNLAIGMTILPPGYCSSFHSHEGEDETWIIFSGKGEVRVEERIEQVSQDSVIFLPRRKRHQITNVGSEPLRMFWIYTPPGPERSILEENMR